MSGNTNATHRTASSSALEAVGSTIIGGYKGDSFTLRTLIIVLPTLAMYNVIELLILIFFTFTKFNGLYFWSLVIASAGIIPYSLGFLFKFANITTGSLRWLSIVLLTIGWYSMVTGQSMVLWSRLHLVLTGSKSEKTLSWTKWMIIMNAFILHIPTTILTFGSNGNTNTAVFVRGYSIMEKIQMSGFFVQEVILSSIYIIAAINILRTSIQDNTKRTMYQLLGINVLILIMDLALLGLEAASLYLLETLAKGVFYSIKLKLEFAILSKLVQIVGKSGSTAGNDERLRQASTAFIIDNDAHEDLSQSFHSTGSATGFQDISDFVDLSQTPADITHAISGVHSPSQARTIRKTGLIDANEQSDHHVSSGRPRSVAAVEVDLARFQHLDDVSLPGDAQLGAGGHSTGFLHEYHGQGTKKNVAKV